MRRPGRWARVAAALLLLLAVLWWVGPDRLRESLTHADPAWFGLALALGIAANVVSALRWASIARALGLKAPRLPLMAMYARGVTSNTLLPGATLSGDTLRAYQLSRLGNPAIESAASVAFDRFSGLWVLCVMSFVAVAVAWSGLSAAPGWSQGQAVFVPYACLMAVIVAAPFIPWPVHWIARLPGSVGQRLVDLWRRLHDPASGLKRRLAGTLIGSAVVQLLSALALAACARSLGIDLPLVWIVAASAPIFVMAALPVGVAGFGTRELAAIGVLGLLGVSAERAAGTGVLVGVCGVIMGILAAPLFFWGRRTS